MRRQSAPRLRRHARSHLRGMQQVQGNEATFVEHAQKEQRIREAVVELEQRVAHR